MQRNVLRKIAVNEWLLPLIFMLQNGHIYAILVFGILKGMKRFEGY